MNTWEEVEAARMKREDEAVARKWARYAHLGRGHLQAELCRWVPERWEEQ